MSIKQDVIKTEGQKQGQPTNNLKMIAAFPENGMYQPVKKGEYYFIVAFDGPPITKNVILGVGQQTSEFDMYGNEISTDIDVKEGKIEYIERKFYLFKTFNENILEENEIAFINVQTNGPAISPYGLNIDQIQVSENDFVQQYVKDYFSFDYSPKDYLTLKKKPKIKITAESLTPFENLCDIILAETIKSYLL